jgi:flagellar biosynthesis protein FlhG
MGDLIGDTLENLVRGSVPAPAPEETPATGGDEPVRAPTPFARSPRPSPRAETPSLPATSRVVAVASGKGGTGKSLIAVNLAVALAESRRVGLIDLDLGLANAHILLGLAPRFDVSHLLAGERSLDEVLIAGPRGVMVLPGASGVPEMTALDDASLDRLAAAVTPLAMRSDVIVLDCPAGLSRQNLLFLHGADIVLVVTTEDLTSMTDAYALIKTLVTHRPNAAVGLVVNDARSAMDGSETYRKISHVARKFLGREIVSMGTIPRDVQLERSARERRPVVLSHPAAPSSRSLQELAGRLTTYESIEPVLGFSERVSRILAAAAGPGSAESETEGSCAS